jgi:hypothetical protein
MLFQRFAEGKAQVDVSSFFRRWNSRQGGGHDGRTGRQEASCCAESGADSICVSGLRASPSYRLHREPALGAEAYREASVAPAFTVLPATGATALCRPRIPDGARYLKYGLFVQSVWEPERARRVRFSGALRFEGAS